jgi:hypothetical protein
MCIRRVSLVLLQGCTPLLALMLATTGLVQTAASSPAMLGLDLGNHKR